MPATSRVYIFPKLHACQYRTDGYHHILRNNDMYDVYMPSCLTDGYHHILHNMFIFDIYVSY